MHARLENAINIGEALGSITTYTHLLSGYLNLYRSFDAALRSQYTGNDELISQVYQSRFPALECDLRSLGADPEDHRCSSSSVVLPSLGDVDSIFGALYVIEGSNLGGQIIYREIQQKLGLDIHSGASFFFGNGEQTGPAWKRFTTLLDDRVSDPDRAAEAAAGMFRAFERHLRCTGDGSSSKL